MVAPNLLLAPGPILPRYAPVQKSDFHLINMFCVVIAVKKYTMSTPGSLLLFYAA